jgi:hypothetical protein
MTDKNNSSALAVHTAGQTMALRPQTLGEAMELAAILSKSTLVPSEYRGKPENVLVAMQLGSEVGLSPFQALQSIAVINGKPAIYGDAGLAIVQASGLLEGMDETDDEATKTATCWMKRKGRDKPVTRTFSQADAERIMMFERDGNGNTIKKKLADRPTWQSFPKRMRQMRARWWVLHDLFPDLLKGMRGREEYEPGSSPIGPEDTEVPNDYQDMMPREKEEVSATVSAPPPPVVVETRAVVVEEEIVVPRRPPPGLLPCGHDNRSLCGPECAEPTQAVLPGTPAPTPAAPPPPPPVAPDTPPPLKVVDEYTTSFEMNGTQYMTNGITKEQLKDTFRLAPQVDRKKGKGTAAKLLRTEFAYEHRVDLSSEEAERYLIRLREIVEN